MLAYQYMALEPTKYFLTLTFYYKKKNIRVLLEFSEEQGIENAEEFYSRLKKYYMEKLKIIL